MVCLTCGYALDGLPSNLCPECGGAFDPADATTFRRVLPDPVQLGRFEMTEAYAACLMLERNGIPAAVHKERGGVIVYAEMPQGSLWVDRADEQRSRKIIQAMAEHTHQKPGEPWACPQCGESIEAQFDSCWSCGEDRPAAEK